MMRMSAIRTFRRGSGFLLLALLGGCQSREQVRADDPLAANTASRSAAPSADTAALRLQVVLRGPDGTALRAVAHRAELPTGAQVGLRLEAEGGQPLWFYPYHRGPDGKLEALSEQPARVGPGAVYELPPGGLWYQLVASASASVSAHAPKENFYVIATRTPLGERLADVLAKLPDERDPPPITNTANRTPGPTYRRVLGDDGMAILLVCLLQTAPPR